MDQPLDKPWTRSQAGLLLGVCKGLADRFQVDVMMVRILWVLAFCFWGFGFFLYLVLAISFPRQGQEAASNESKLFGVCLRFSKRFAIDVGLVRAGTLLSLVPSGGTTLLLYVALYFILPTIEEIKK